MAPYNKLVHFLQLFWNQLFTVGVCGNCADCGVVHRVLASMKVSNRDGFGVQPGCSKAVKSLQRAIRGFY